MLELTSNDADVILSLYMYLFVQSERNAVFYKQDGFTSAYPKLQVYPPEGGEVQLEQLRARLHRYAPPPPSPPQNVNISHATHV